MKYLFLTSLIGLFLFPTQPSATEEAPLNIILRNTSRTFGVPYRLLVAVMKVESNGNPIALNPHDGGSPSFGAFQIKMNTAKFLGFRGTKESLMNFHTNAKYAAMYLRFQLDRYQNNWMKAANAYRNGTYDGNLLSEYNQRIMGALMEGI
jgi:soluble lytic murein transglycosylase-like protein